MNDTISPSARIPAGHTPGGYTATVFADGAPGGLGAPNSGWDEALRNAPAAPASAGVVGKVTQAASRIRQFEGPRGYSVRATVIAKHVAWFATIVVCTALTHWAFAVNPQWRFGGLVMLYSVAFMLAVSAVGSILYADSRIQIYDQTRHFVFGIVLLPGTALALFMRLVNQALSGPTASNDMFAQILAGNGMPLIYFSLVVIPAFVLAKYVFGGIRSINRSAMADEEQLAVLMRQDGWQR